MLKTGGKMNIAEARKGDNLGCVEKGWFTYGPVLEIDKEQNKIVLIIKGEMRAFDAGQLWPLPAIIIGQIKTIGELRGKLRATSRGEDQSFQLLVTICREADDFSMYFQELSEKEEIDTGSILAILAEALLKNPERKKQAKAIYQEKIERRANPDQGMLRFKQRGRPEQEQERCVSRICQKA